MLYTLPPSSRFGMFPIFSAGAKVAPMAERHDRLRQARIAAGFERASDAATRFGWNENTYKSNENGNAPFSFRKARDYAEAFGVRAEWLYDETAPTQAGSEPMVRIIGRVGADTEGTV